MSESPTSTIGFTEFTIISPLKLIVKTSLPAPAAPADPVKANSAASSNILLENRAKFCPPVLDTIELIPDIFTLDALALIVTGLNVLILKEFNFTFLFPSMPLIDSMFCSGVFPLVFSSLSLIIIIFFLIESESNDIFIRLAAAFIPSYIGEEPNGTVCFIFLSKVLTLSLAFAPVKI